jgi:hypothetical protein
MEGVEVRVGSSTVGGEEMVRYEDGTGEGVVRRGNGKTVGRAAVVGEVSDSSNEVVFGRECGDKNAVDGVPKNVPHAWYGARSVSTLCVLTRATENPDCRERETVGPA